MITIENKAGKILEKYSSGEPAIDPLLLLTIIKLISEGIAMLYKCYNTPKHLNDELRNPSFATKLFLAKLVNKHCRGMNVNQRKLRKEILETDFTEQELASLIKESQS